MFIHILNKRNYLKLRSIYNLNTINSTCFDKLSSAGNNNINERKLLTKVSNIEQAKNVGI